MISRFKKKSLKWTGIAIVLALLAGCSSLTGAQNSDQNSPQESTVNQGENSGQNSSTSSESGQQNQESAASADHSSLINSIMEQAKQGKVPGCEFSVRTTVIDQVEDAWGKADTTDYVAAAKGSYATYASRGITFGFNKGEQIFEVRSSGKQVKQISLSQIEKALGTPTYHLDNQTEKIIGYVASSDYKLEFVLDKSKSNPFVDHVNVLYPAGTVNSMADDPGRQW